MAFKMAGWSAFKQITPDNEKTDRISKISIKRRGVGGDVGKTEMKMKDVERDETAQKPTTHYHETAPTKRDDTTRKDTAQEGVPPEPKMGPHNKIVGEQKKFTKVKGKIKRTPPGPTGRKI